jgi:PKD repeat protein
MRKFLHTLLTLVFFFVFSQAKAQVSNVVVDPGPYAPNSTIAATFTLGTACVPINNVFQLFLSDAAGNFVSTTPIGTYNGFYSTFVNGVIPIGTPSGTGYRVFVRSSGLGTDSAPSGPFTIVNTGTAAIAKLTSSSTISTNPVTFGTCNSSPGATFRFANESSTPTVTATITNELNGGAPTVLTYTSNTPSDNTRAITSVDQAHFTIFVRAVMPDGTIGTQAYFLVNNKAITAFSTTGTTTVCFPNGLFEYNVDIATNNGIRVNFPGNTYRINWGDTFSNEYTICDIRSANGRVQHIFTRSSCGLTYSTGTETTYNAFGVNVNVNSPFCGRVGAPLSTPAIVVTKPDNRFSFPPIACLNDFVPFTNESIAGQKPSNNSSNCTDNLVFYNWYVDGVLIAEDKPKSFTFLHQFTTKGTHTILLTSQSDGGCQADPISQTICIQDPPRPSFTLPTNTVCLLPGTLTATSTSIFDNTCPNTPTYLWSVTVAGTNTPASGVTYVGGTNVNSVNPQFKFSQIGIYDIRLTVASATCQSTTPAQRVVVNSEPQATLQGAKNLCVKGDYSFDPNATDTKTVISGTAEDLPGTYTWTVAGGAYTFVAPTTANSKYPKINFADFGTYTVTLTYTNNCNTITRTQELTFTEAPVVTISGPTQICYGATIPLQGGITNDAGTTFTWSSSGGGTFVPANNLNTVYTPTPAEQNAGSAVITLLVRTTILGACAEIPITKTIIILPRNTGTNATSQICTGETTNYTPNSTVTGSTFTWTASNADGNATNFSASGAGPILETINNISATSNAIVVYTITPSSNGCAGEPFTFTVSVTPRPIINAAPLVKTICSNNSSAISVTSNIPITFTWTSTATNGITGNTAIGSQTTIGTTLSINDILINRGLAPNSNVQGAVTYVISSYSASGCRGNDITITVNVDPAVTVANAGPDADICSTNTYLLNGNSLKAGETGLWTVSPTPAHAVTPIFSDATSPQTTVSMLTAGESYVFIWTITGSGACGATNDQVTVNVNIPTVAGVTGTTGPPTVCEGTNTGTITLSGNTGTVLRWESSTDGGTTWTALSNTANTLTYTFTNITVATQYRAVVRNGECNIENSSATSILVTPATTIAQAGPDQILCAQPSTLLAAGPTLKTGETGLWTRVSGPNNAAFTDATNPNTTVTNLVPGNVYVFRWTISGLSPCGPTANDVTINNLPPLTNTISSTSTEVCNGQVITITGSTPTGGDGTYAYTWESSADGNNWTVITGQTGKDLIYTLSSTLTFRRTVNSSACTLVSNTYTVIAQAPITNNIIAADQSICTGNVPVPLTGSIPTGSNGNFSYQWQSSVDNTNWTDVSGAVFANYAPLALTTTTSFRRVVSTLTCTGNLRNISNAVTITVRPNAKAEFTYTLDKACTPFVIDGNNIKAVPYPDRNATYTWYADNVVIGTGINFPGYTISTSNATVTIKLVTTPSTGCLPDEMSHDFSTNPAVAATFTQSATQGCGPLAVTFVNTSTSLTTGTFRWNFGNGTTSSQVMPGPVTFLPDPTGKDTTYTVTLTATTSCGTSSVTSTVFVKAKPIAVFSPSKTTGCSPMTVTFTNTSPGGTNTYYYDFGDGTLLTKTDKSPVQHTFITNTVRDFVVTMIAENECGRDQSSYTIRVSPNTVLPELVVNANEKEGCAPFRVNFYNNSRGANLFKYDFGDGSTVITRSAPEVVAHTFNTPGTYTITLTASNGCSDTTTTESITVLPQPLASFTADNTLGCPGLVVQFRNTSTDGVSYLWDFGDGTTSTELQPRHVFTGDKEYYTISLTATNSLGCTYTAIMNEYIHIVAPPVARFNVAPSTLISIPNYTFRFENESTGNPTIWAWDFGDGVKSTLQNPSHTYLDTGSYVVTLRVSNQQGCFTTTFKTVTIVGVPGYLYVPNSFMPGSETPELRVFMAKGSGIKTWTMTVFNKWGQTLWQTNKLDEGRPVEWWDGVYNGIPVPQGVYFWKIDVEFINGTAWKGMTYDSKAPKKTGVIHLLR